jgi:hypothetical protein
MTTLLQPLRDIPAELSETQKICNENVMKPSRFCKISPLTCRRIRMPNPGKTDNPT